MKLRAVLLIALVLFAASATTLVIEAPQLSRNIPDVNQLVDIVQLFIKPVIILQEPIDTPGGPG